MAREFDLVVLGAGPGGYVAAIRAAQLGMNVAVVEKDKLGGTCLHRGCIPSKALLRSAEVYATLVEGEKYGVEAGSVTLNFAKVQARKRAIVEQLHKGVQHLMKKGKITVVKGYGRLMGPSIFSPRSGAIRVETLDGEQEILVPEHVLIATGSRPRTLPGLEVDGTVVMTSDEALEMETLPKSIVIVGGGVIGVEWASMLRDFGVEVTIVEFLDRILPTEDEEISKEMTRILKKRGVTIHTGAKVLPETFRKTESGFTIEADKGGQRITLSAEKMLVSVGRLPNVEDIGLESTEIELEKGFIKVNEFFQTKEKHIYAIGDVIATPQLAHVASHEGIVAVEHMAGLNPDPIDYTKIPRVTYSRPEVASVGLTEREAREKGFEVKVGKFNFRGNGKALIFGEPDGFVKVVADAKTNDLLGVHIIGPHASDLITEAGLARVLDATPWEVAHTVHPHPTLAEAIMEAALAVDGKAIHGA